MGGAASCSSSSSQYKSVQDITPLINPEASAVALNLHLPQNIQIVDFKRLSLNNVRKQLTFWLTEHDALLRNKYRLISVVGSVFSDGDTTYSTILGECIDTNKAVSIKCINHSLIEENNFSREVHILQSLSTHCGIVTLVDAVVDPAYLYLVTEYLEMDLSLVVHQHQYSKYNKHNKPKGLHAQRALDMFHQILLSLKFCHEHGVHHLHLTPFHILVDANDHCKLTGFEKSWMKTFNTTASSSSAESAASAASASISPSTMLEEMDAFVGDEFVYEYSSPEALLIHDRKKKKVAMTGTASDVWSAGCILVFMCKGMPPFGTANDKGGLKKLKQRISRRTPNLSGLYSLAFCHLCFSMLQKKQNDRILIQSALHHDWFHEATIQKNQPIAVPCPFKPELADQVNIVKRDGLESTITTSTLLAKKRRDAAGKMGAFTRGNLVRLNNKKEHYAAVQMQSVVRGGIQRNEVHRGSPVKTLRETRSVPSLLERRSNKFDRNNLSVKVQNNGTAATTTNEKENDCDKSEMITASFQLGEGLNGGRSILNGTIDAKLLLPPLPILGQESFCVTPTLNWLIPKQIMVGSIGSRKNSTKEEIANELLCLKNVGVTRVFSLGDTSTRPFYQGLLAQIWEPREESRSRSRSGSGSGSGSPTKFSLSRTLSASSLLSLVSPSSSRSKGAHNLPKCTRHLVVSGKIMPDNVLSELRDLVLESILLMECPFIEGHEGMVLQAVVLAKLYRLTGHDAVQRVQSYRNTALQSTQNEQNDNFHNMHSNGNEINLSQAEIEQVVRICQA